MPSNIKDKNRSYVVGPNSVLKVNIIIKGEKYVGPITFTAEDLETESKLLLNEAFTSISVTPSETPHTITNIVITAEGTVCKNEK